jgi:ABC-type sulfate/molybdate transport systems ATPase subunit
VGELLELVGLAGFGARAVHELSGGEAQRVALARALAPEPALLMLDEPFGSLDRVLREQLTEEVRRLLHELSQTALHVTHDQGEAFALADRVAVLADGRLVQVGAPAELWHRPASAFVAEFLGHPNRWLARQEGSGMLSVHGLPLGAPPAGTWPSGVGVPPVDWSGSAAAAQPDRWVGSVPVVVPVTALRVGADGQLVGQVTGVEFRQGRYRVTVAVMEPVAVTEPLGVTAGVMEAEPPLRAVYESDTEPGVGETVRLLVDVTQIWPLA